MSARIIQNGGSPRVEGTRITVYDVMDYLTAGWTDGDMAFILKLTDEQLQAAKQYIAENREVVAAEYQRILDRDAAGNPPELSARLEETHRRVQKLLQERRSVKESAGAGSHG